MIYAQRLDMIDTERFRRRTVGCRKAPEMIRSEDEIF